MPETDFPRSSEAPAHARRAVAEWLGPSVSTRALEDAKLLVSELVTNAVRHPQAEGRVALKAAVRRGSVRIEVSDPGAGFAKPRVGEPPPDALGGRGLLIVDRIASSWGISPGRPTRVWFELRV